MEATILQPAVGGTIQIRKKKYRQLEDALHRFKVQFENGDRSVMNYVDAVSHLTAEYYSCGEYYCAKLLSTDYS